jgi:F-type H+-transporting ATPase subunit c
MGIGRIGGSAGEGIARQPEAEGAIKGAALIFAAFVEGVALFAAVIGLMLATQ